MAHNYQTRNKKEEQEQEQEDVAIPIINNETPTIELINHVAQTTAPDFSFLFLFLFCAAAYFYETHSDIVTVSIGIWATFQLVVYVINEDFRADVFWNTCSLLGHFCFYLILGLLWSFAKLYLDVWQNYLPKREMSSIITCVSHDGKSGCAMEFLLVIKWRIVRTMLAWPVSLIYTLSRDPLKILTDLLFDTFSGYYLRILQSAVAANQAHSHQPAASWSGIGWTIGYIFSYLILGYIWTHIKLFVDVWRGTLPRSLDEDIKAVYKGDKNYWNFVTKIKHLVIQWILFWPISIIYTILRHPVKIIVDIVYRLSQRKYTWIVEKAMNTRMKEE